MEKRELENIQKELVQVFHESKRIAAQIKASTTEQELSLKLVAYDLSGFERQSVEKLEKLAERIERIQDRVEELQSRNI